MLSNKWLKFLSFILLIYPFIWLFKRFHRKGGGTWEVCGGAYPLKQWVPMGQEEVIPPGVQQEETLPPYDADSISWSNPALSPRGSLGLNAPAMARTSSSTRYIQTASGMKKLVGVREGEWFRVWEGLVTRAVLGRYQSNQPLGSGAFIHAHELDGYSDSTTGPLISV
jgi:hypothetical protein